jgi:C4-dicarboxylate transporter DctQ subunit
MAKLDIFLDRLERWGIFLCFSTCLVVLILGVLTRYVFMRPLSWPDELSTYLFILMTFLGASASIRSNQELRVDALVERFPWARFGLDLWMHSVRLIAAIIFIWTGIKFVQVELVFMNISPILHIPIPLVFSMLPMFGVLLVLRTMLQLVQLFREG